MRFEHYMIAMEDQNRPNYFRIAWQSALAAALCLGLPAGLLLWLILFQQIIHSAIIDQTVTLLQINGLISIFVLAVCSLMWSYLLARISGYRPWWKIGLATVLGIIVGWFSPLSNLDGVFADQFPIHTLYVVAMCGIVGVVTACVGLAYGLILRNMKAALTMAFTTSLVSVLTLLLTVIVFDQFGIRVGGTVPLAMSKVTVTSLLTSAITGGMVLGIGFTKCRIISQT
ncbi:MAG TPA: hypothetical protein VF918_20635 [Anaerolineales bacterium]